MKRDLDLVRQLLLDIEGHGPECSLTSLRTGMAQDADERVRYHLRLMIDAGLLKELDRTASGVPCVRLTHAGHELAELARSDARWREAKWVAQETTGGQSLTVVRGLLLRWSLRAERARPHYAYYRPAYRQTHRYSDYAPLAYTPLAYEPLAYDPLAYRGVPVRRPRLVAEPAPYYDADLRLVRSGPDYRERHDSLRYPAPLDRYEYRGGYDGRYGEARYYDEPLTRPERDLLYPSYNREPLDIGGAALDGDLGATLPGDLL